MNMLLSRSRHRIRAVEEMTEDWNESRVDTPGAAQFEEVVAESLEVARFLTERVTAVTNSFFRGDPCPVDYTKRLLLLGHAERGVRLLKKTTALADDVRRRNTLKRYEELGEAVRRLEDATNLLRKTCPEFDKEMIARTGEAIRNGDTLTAEEFLAHAQGDGVG